MNSESPKAFLRYPHKLSAVHHEKLKCGNKYRKIFAYILLSQLIERIARRSSKFPPQQTFFQFGPLCFGGITQVLEN